MELKKVINDRLSLVLITDKNCNVCKIVYPRLQEVVKKIANLDFYHLERENSPEITGELMIFTVPAILIFSKGIELYRAARFLNLKKIENIVTDHYNKIFKENHEN